MRVAILSTGALRSANNQSVVSTAATTVALGSWGDGLVTNLVPKSTSAVRVVMTVPLAVSGRYPVTRLLVQVGICWFCCPAPHVWSPQQHLHSSTGLHYHPLCSSQQSTRLRCALRGFGLFAAVEREFHL